MGPNHKPSFCQFYRDGNIMPESQIKPKNVILRTTVKTSNSKIETHDDCERSPLRIFGWILAPSEWGCERLHTTIRVNTTRGTILTSKLTGTQSKSCTTYCTIHVLPSRISLTSKKHSASLQGQVDSCYLGKRALFFLSIMWHPQQRCLLTVVSITSAIGQASSATFERPPENFSTQSWTALRDKHFPP
jgi:hypothetical protein